MIINILSEKDFLDLLYGDWEFTDEALVLSLKVFNHHATALAM
jgi:hypothetical protein